MFKKLFVTAAAVAAVAVPLAGVAWAEPTDQAPTLQTQPTLLAQAVCPNKAR